ncbi:MAG: GntR family transcriptional regulator [Gemmatimonadota bacterium]
MPKVRPAPTRPPRPKPSRPWAEIGPVATVAERAAEALREKILGGAFEPGEFIRQDDVARGLGVSRMPVREALMILTNEGFVTRVPRRGFQIPDRPVRALVDLYPILTVLERHAGKASLSELTPADLAHLQRTNTAMHQAVRAAEAARTLGLNLEFHRILASRCGNARLVELLEQLGREVLQLEFWSFANPTHRAIADQEHDGIIAALLRRDFAEALRRMEANRLLAYDAFRKQFEEPPAPRPRRAAKRK